MTAEQKAAYAISMAALAMIEAIAMQTANQRAVLLKTNPPHMDYDFTALIEKHGIHHNALMTLFSEWS